MEAGFSVFDESSEHDNDTIVVIDFDDCENVEIFRAHQSRGVKIVALTSQADSRELNPDDIVPLSGVLTYDLGADALVRSLRLIGSGERMFPRDLALGRRPQGPSAPEPQSDSARLSPREKRDIIPSACRALEQADRAGVGHHRSHGEGPSQERAAQDWRGQSDSGGNLGAGKPARNQRPSQLRLSGTAG